MGIGIAVLVIVVVLVAVLVSIYNGLVSKRNTVEAAWSNIDVQLQRRYDLIPNLVNTVKGYAAHEKETLEKVISARTACMNTASPAELGKLEGTMQGALKSLFAVAESYPELKANQNFLALQEELAGTENKVAYSRTNYNNAVRSFNTALQTFPGMLLAGKFQAKEMFEVDAPEARKAVKVEF